MPLSDLTSPAAVVAALDEFDELGREAFLSKYGFGRARRYFVRRGTNYYDSKAIAGAAIGYEFPADGAMKSTEFRGGEHGAKAKLEALGFDVVARPALAAADTLPLRAAITTALVAQQERTPNEWSDDLQKVMAVTMPNAIRAVVGENFRVKGSAGAGNQAEIPWVSVLPPSIKGASEGRYIVYLFSASGDSVFLSLSQAVTGQAKSGLDGLAADLRQEAGPHPELLGHIDLGATGDLGQKYELATAYAIEYRADSLPSQQELEADLKHFLEVLDVVLGASGTNGLPPPSTQFEWEWLLEQTNWSANELERLRDAIRDDSPQTVLAGPPGTSKTWVAKAIARHLTNGDPERVRMVQFHPSYGYEDFIEGLRPTIDDDGRVSFQPVPGAVIRFVEDIGYSPESHFLLIDEMNRANLSRVFGELMYLFEYRDEELDLRFTKAFCLPPNLRFIGTMNTADRSIRSIDIALRRRFDVFELTPEREILERFYSKNVSTNHVPTLYDGFEKLNADLAELLDRHHAIGHAFFMRPHLTIDVLRGVWTRKIGPLIEEYLFDQPDVAAAFTASKYWPELGES